MLVLSRKPGESIQIDENIFITVSEVRGGRVRLSIDAPESVRILRKELLQREFPVTAKPIVLETAEAACTLLN